MSEFRNIV